MAKRFIDTGLFDDAWFMKLSTDAKLLWIYSITKCNHAGILEINEDLCIFQTKIKKSLASVRQEIGNRWQTLENEKIFIPKFISFQYPNGLHNNVIAQKSVLKELSKYNLWDKENQSVRQLIDNSSLTVKDKDQDIVKDKDMDIKGDCKGGDDDTRIPESSLAFLWNAVCVNLPKVISLSDKRNKQEKLRLSERTLEDWEKVFIKLNTSEFCKGNNNTGWKATYDWIILNTDNSIKVMEGKYDGQIRNSKREVIGKAEASSGKPSFNSMFHGLNEKDYTDGAIN